MIKKFLLRLVKYSLKLKLYYSHSRIINNKLRYLKKNQKFSHFPFVTIEPALSKYPQFSRTDKKYFNFFYSVNGIADPEYIPLTYYYSIIEPKLNDRLLSAAIKDKNFYELYLKDIPVPDVKLRKISGLYYDKNYEQIFPDEKLFSHLVEENDRLILKPSIESGAGKSILLFQRKNGKLVSNDQSLDYDFFQKYRQDFIIQEFVKQHEFFKRFNPASNNTLRIFTYRSIKNDKIKILHKLLRIGKEGSFLDHDNFGGVAISITDDNSFNGFAYNSNGEKFSSVNNINFLEAGQVPFIAETCNLAEKIAKKIFYARLLAMDFTIDESGTSLLLEINCWNNGISQYQISNGSLFKEFTSEILEYCK